MGLPYLSRTISCLRQESSVTRVESLSLLELGKQNAGEGKCSV